MIDCTNHAKARLKFKKNYRVYDDHDHLQVAEVDIRVWDDVAGWGKWTQVAGAITETSLNVIIPGDATGYYCIRSSE